MLQLILYLYWIVNKKCACRVSNTCSTCANLCISGWSLQKLSRIYLDSPLWFNLFRLTASKIKFQNLYAFHPKTMFSMTMITLFSTNLQKVHPYLWCSRAQSLVQARWDEQGTVYLQNVVSSETSFASAREIGRETVEQKQEVKTEFERMSFPVAFWVIHSSTIFSRIDMARRNVIFVWQYFCQSLFLPSMFPSFSFHPIQITSENLSESILIWYK